LFHLNVGSGIMGFLVFISSSKKEFFMKRKFLKIEKKNSNHLKIKLKN